MKMNTLCAAVAAGLLAMAGTSIAQTTTTTPSDRSATPSQTVAPSTRVGGDSSGALPSENCTSLSGAEKAACEDRNAGRASTGSSTAPATSDSTTSGSTTAPVSGALPAEQCTHLTGFEKEKCEARNARATSSAGSSAAPAATTGSTTAPAVTTGAAATGDSVSSALPSESCENLSGFEKEKCEERNARDRSSTGTSGTGTTTTPGGR